MNGVRAPRFAGVTGGVGTTTLATALHGVDTGRFAGGPVDVLVCGIGSLATAARLGGPVLAVVADRAPRIDRLAAGFGAVVTVPEIAAWRELDVPDVAGLLGVVPERRSAWMRPYVDALLEITAALVRSGVLEGAPRPVRPTFSPAAMVRPVVLRQPQPVAPDPTRRPRVSAPAPGPSGRRGSAAAARTAVERIAAAASSPAAPRPAAVVDPPTTPSETAGPASTPVVPGPVVHRPVGPAPVSPAPEVVDAHATGRDREATGRPLWRGLQAVERTPVLLSAAAPAPVPVSRAASTAPEPVGGRPLRLHTELDDDAVESLRIG